MPPAILALDATAAIAQGAAMTRPRKLAFVPGWVHAYVVGWLCWRAAQEDEPRNQEDARHSGAPETRHDAAP